MLDSKVIANVFLAEPLIGYYLSRSKIIDDGDLPAIACIDVVGGEIFLKVNSIKFNELELSKQIGTLIHEYLHPLLCHCDKRSFGTTADAWRANVAQDITRHFELPDGAVFPDSCGYNFPRFQSAEFYFNELGKDLDKFEKTFGPPLEPPTIETLVAISRVALEFSNTHNTCGSGLIAADCGSPELVKTIIGTRANVVDWRSEIKQFLHWRGTSGYINTFKRPSRRLGNLTPGKVSRPKSRVPVILDTSASMTSHLQSAIDEILSLTNETEVLLFQCDTKLVSRQSIKNQDLLNVWGGGGTNLQEAVDAVQLDGFRKCLIISDEEYAVKLNTHCLSVLYWNPKNGQIRKT
jgi:hypothetical protein